ncbi:iron-containing alcohol dehydrogenase family protein, partial [Bacteroidota bacterium]
MDHFEFYMPTKIIFGEGKISELKKHVPDNINKILIVTDKDVAEKSGALNKINSQLKDKSLLIIDEIEENPSVQQINNLGKYARYNNIELVIGLGGGSCMDAAKGIALLATNESNINEYLDGKDLENKPLQNICIPTSSGTGSEATPYAVFTDRKNSSKKALSFNELFPLASIIDPELSWSMPEAVIINTGFDALTHCIEAYLSTETFELNDHLALQGIKLVIDNLSDARKKDKKAMSFMSYASLLGGITIAHASTILLHIMGYPLTVYHKIPHGKANAILLASFMNFMKEKSSVKNKVLNIDKIFESKGGIKKYVQSFGISTSLSDYN